MEGDVHYEEDAENHQSQARFSLLPVPASPCTKNRKDEVTQLPGHEMNVFLSSQSVEYRRDQSASGVRTGKFGAFRRRTSYQQRAESVINRLQLPPPE